MAKDGWTLPDFAKVGIVGVLAFLVLFLVGAIPYLPSPIIEIKQAIAEHNRQTTGPIRLICKGIWRDNPPMQAECER